MADKEKFRDLLAQAIQRIGRMENKKLAAVQDELGYALGRAGGTAIGHWRKGHLPKTTDVEQLGKLLVQRSDLDRDWLRDFLVSADFPYPDQLCQALFPSEHATPLAMPPTDHAETFAQFDKPFRQLVGRDAYLTELMDVLGDTQARKIVAIDGMGGIGKTALVYEVALRSIQQQLFEQVIWASATRNPEGHDTRLTFDSVLDTMARALNLPDIAQLGMAEKELRLRTILRRQRLLLVLDNLETAGESQATILRRLQPLLGASKALVTSRRRFASDFYTLHLDGLPTDTAQQFLQQEAKDRRITQFEMATPHELAEIIRVTGGSPLAMKLLVGQASYLPLAQVIAHLRVAQPLRSDQDEDEYLQFYQSIYFPSWDLLVEPAKELLIALTTFAPGTGGTLDAICATSNMTSPAVLSPLADLWHLSFVEVGQAAPASLNAKRYYLHALTHYFVLSHIVNLPTA